MTPSRTFFTKSAGMTSLFGGRNNYAQVWYVLLFQLFISKAIFLLPFG